MQRLKNVRCRSSYSGKSHWESVISHPNKKMLAGEEFGKAEREKLELQVFRFFHILFISIFFLKNFKHFQNCPHEIVRKAKSEGVCVQMSKKKNCYYLHPLRGRNACRYRKDSCSFLYGLSRLESALSFSCEDVWGNPVLWHIPGRCTLAVSLGNNLDLYK